MCLCLRSTCVQNLGIGVLELLKKSWSFCVLLSLFCGLWWWWSALEDRGGVCLLKGWSCSSDLFCQGVDCGGRRGSGMCEVRWGGFEWLWTSGGFEEVHGSATFMSMCLWIGMLACRANGGDREVSRSGQDIKGNSSCIEEFLLTKIAWSRAGQISWFGFFFPISLPLSLEMCLA